MAIVPARHPALLDYLTSEKVRAGARNRLYVIGTAGRWGVTLLLFPAGSNYFKKIFLFVRFDSNLAHILLDNSLSCVV